MRLKDKIGIVTAAASGMGRAGALRFAKEGAAVGVVDIDRAGVEAVVAEIKALGREAVLVEGDAFEHDSCHSIVDRALYAFGRLDILISNPAFSRRGDFLNYPIETFQQVLQGTLTGGFSMSQHVANHMVERGGGGKIVFISSCHVHTPYARSVAYNSAKG